jgi:NAD(P)-dependent dehydrogenase (short-subunit alcohol dehydrogenase family)
MSRRETSPTASFAADLFAGQTVFVSGASSGIGLEIARGFRDLGAQVVATGSSPRKLSDERAEERNAGIAFRQVMSSSTVPASRGRRTSIGMTFSKT